MRPSLEWLLVFVPVCILLEFLAPDRHGLIFVAACIAIIPLAGLLGEATEHLANRTSDGLGGLLNATFGNAAELIISIAALQKGLYEVVKASLTGSIIGNILLVLGGSIFAGGLRHKVLRFNAIAARSQSTMLTLAAISLIAPAAFRFLGGPSAKQSQGPLSQLIAAVLFLVYLIGLYFSLHTHKQYFSGEPLVVVAGEADDETIETWPLRKSLLVLGIATAFTAWISEILVNSVEAAARSAGLTTVFIGIVVVAIIGNAAEHSTAVMMALKNKMDLTMGIAIGSSIQIAMFVAPFSVLISRWVGPRPMDLVFSPAEVLAVVLAVAIAGQIASDGESNWLQGIQLLAVYVILASVFYFIPEVATELTP